MFDLPFVQQKSFLKTKEINTSASATVTNLLVQAIVANKPDVRISYRVSDVSEMSAFPLRTTKNNWFIT